MSCCVISYDIMLYYDNYTPRREESGGARAPLPRGTQSSRPPCVAQFALPKQARGFRARSASGRGAPARDRGSVNLPLAQSAHLFGAVGVGFAQKERSSLGHSEKTPERRSDPRIWHADAAFSGISRSPRSTNIISCNTI